MTVSLELVPAFTRAGLDAVLNAQADGFSARITHLAFGDGGTSGYTPQGTETALRRERERVPIHFSMKDGTGSFRVRGMGAPSQIEYWVREVGIVLEDGTLLALWSDPDRAITGRGPGAELEFDIKLVLAALPGDAFEIVVTSGGDRTLTALAGLTLASISAERRGLEDFLKLRALDRAGAHRDTRLDDLIADGSSTLARLSGHERRSIALHAALAVATIRNTHAQLTDHIAARRAA